MATKRGPTLRSQWLGKQLREMRESAQLTLKDVAARMRRDASSISRMEAGVHPARVPDVLAYVDLCGVGDQREREALLRLARDVWQTGWWERYAGEMPVRFLDRIWLESRATMIQSFHPMVVPGLLQTGAYARAIIRANDLDATEDHIGRGVEVRLTRQSVLDRDDFHLVSILDESVFHRTAGDTVTMRHQIEHLIELTRRQSIEVHVLPLAAGQPPSRGSGFEILSLVDPYSDVGYIESAAGEMYLERDDVDSLTSRFARTRAMSLGGHESVAFMRGLARQLGEV